MKRKYYLCKRFKFIEMESKEYFEKVMQNYNQNRNGRSLRKYCKDEAIDYNWVIFEVHTYGHAFYQKWFTDGKFLKPEFEQCKVTHELSKETLILILSTSVQTKIRI